MDILPCHGPKAIYLRKNIEKCLYRLMIELTDRLFAQLGHTLTMKQVFLLILSWCKCNKRVSYLGIKVIEIWASYFCQVFYTPPHFYFSNAPQVSLLIFNWSRCSQKVLLSVASCVPVVHRCLTLIIDISLFEWRSLSEKPFLYQSLDSDRINEE